MKENKKQKREKGKRWTQIHRGVVLPLRRSLGATKKIWRIQIGQVEQDRWTHTFKRIEVPAIVFQSRRED